MLKTASCISGRPFFVNSRILFEYTAICLELCRSKIIERMKDYIKIVFASVLIPAMIGCRELPDESLSSSSYIKLEEVAEILAMIPIDRNQLDEVHQAVASSSGNGYDEEE